MKEQTRKLITIISLVIALLSCIFAVLFAMGNKSGKYGGMFDITFWVLVCAIALTLGAWILFAVISFIKSFKENPKAAKKTIITAAIAIVAVVVSYILASGTDVADSVLETYNVTTSSSKLIGAGCILVYILVIAAFCSIIYVEASKLIKKK